MEPNNEVVARMRRAIIEILDGMQDGQIALVAGHGDILTRYVRADTEKKIFLVFVMHRSLN